MAITLVTTVGGATTNSYQTLAAITARAELLPGYADWIGLASDDDRNWCAVHATTLLDRLRWLGTRVTDTQARQLPRYNLPNPESLYSSWGRGSAFASDAIPEPVLKAHAIIAVGLAALGGRDGGEIVAIESGGIASAKIGDISFSMSGGTSARLSATDFPDVAEVLEGMIA